MYPGLALKYAQIKDGIIPIIKEISNSSNNKLDLSEDSGNLGTEESWFQTFVLLTKRKYLHPSPLGMEVIEGVQLLQVRETFINQFSSINGLPSQYLDQ